MSSVKTRDFPLDFPLKHDDSYRNLVDFLGVELDATRHAAAVRLRDHGVERGLITPEESDRIYLANKDAFVPGTSLHFQYRIHHF